MVESRITKAVKSGKLESSILSLEKGLYVLMLDSNIFADYQKLILK